MGMRYLVSGSQMKEVDSYTIQSIGIPSLVLMEQAAAAVVREVQKKAEKKGLRIVKEYQNHDLVFCDPLKMSQVVLNLLSNAIKYSDRGTITLKTREEGSWYVLQVRDEGHGIVAEDLEKIFDRFYRVDDDRSRSSGGSGLGLSIVKSIVEAHHGEIKVESEFDKGTTFTVRLKN